jgi:hypothetical protein
MRKFLFMTTAAAGALGLSLAGPASAQGPQGATVLRADLQPVPHDPAVDGGSEVTGRAKLVMKGDQVRISLQANGLSPNLPHAMHIHGELQARNECPSLAADTNGDGLIDTVEGLPDYGPIDVSFTTTGGTSGDFVDALALDRFPVANDSGNLHYNRAIDVPSDLVDALDRLHIVVHGADLNGNGAYDFDAGTSSLSGLVGAAVPLEGELPVACGTIG